MKIFQFPGTTYDGNAQDYILRVEMADANAGQAQGLEQIAKDAINNLFLGLKLDNILFALSSSCILAVARTRQGSLVPLLSTMPARASFGTGNGWSYDRKTGTKANGTDNYIATNRSNAAEPQDNKSFGVYVTEPQTRTMTRGIIGTPTAIGGSQLVTTTTQRAIRVNPANVNLPPLGADIIYVDNTNSTGLWAATRNNSSQVNVFIANTLTTYSQASGTPVSETIDIFRRSTNYSDARVLFDFIGVSINLALLNNRLTAFESAIAAL